MNGCLHFCTPYSPSRAWLIHSYSSFWSLNHVSSVKSSLASPHRPSCCGRLIPLSFLSSQYTFLLVFISRCHLKLLTYFCYFTRHVSLMAEVYSSTVAQDESLADAWWVHSPFIKQYHLAHGVGTGINIWNDFFLWFSSVQFSSVTQSCPTLCDPMNSSTPGLPVHHQLLESTQTHVHWVGDAIQPSPFSSCPQSLPASGSFPMSQLFTWGDQITGVSASASVLPVNTQDWSPLGWTGWISLQSKGLSRVFSNTTFQKHRFFSAQLSSQSNSHIYTWPLEKP